MMQDWLAAQAYARPDGMALIAGDQPWTYRALNEAVGRMAGALSAQGIQRGDLVAALLPNCAGYVILIHALARLGAVLIPLNTRLTATELQVPLTITAAKWLVTDTHDESLPGVQLETLQLLDVTQLLETEATPITDSNIDLERTQAIVFTSGTTGQPKGATITFGNQFWSTMGSAYRLGTLPEDRWLCCLSLFHIGGLAIVMRCCLYGTTVILQQGFNIAEVVRAASRHQATLISLVPTMVYRMLNEPEAVSTLQQMRLVLIGGAAASPDLLETCASLSVQAAPTYGLSEACSQVVTMLPAEARRKPGSVGKPLLFSKIEILDEHGAVVPPGTYGEVVVSGPTVMAGYYNNPDATARTIRDGRLYTGDIGYLDSDGDLWLVQRRSDLIVSGGENVYPVEVENALLQHGAVEAVCVVGIPNAEWGHQVAAAVVLKANTTASGSELLDFCRHTLAGYKVPRVIRFVGALPMTASGKIQRKSVADLFASNA